MANDTGSPRKLDRIVFGWGAPAPTLERLRSAFPGLDIKLATDSAFIEALPTADAAVAWSMSPAEYAAATKLQWFQSIGAGVERVLLPGMRDSGLIVTNTSGIHSSNISEHVLAMMLAFARQLPALFEGQRAGEWRDGSDIRGRVFELSGQTLLVVGFGDIGQALASKANALGMRVLAVKRRPETRIYPYLARLATIADLPALVGEADHVAICLPQTTETSGLFDAALLARMKPGSYLYNIGRGPIVDTEALTDAITSGRLGGAGLDVTEPEPLPPDSPLWQAANVIITSHTAGSTPHFWSRITEILVENIYRFRSGAPLINVVDHDTGY